jgi:hypothetical protein
MYKETENVLGVSKQSHGNIFQISEEYGIYMSNQLVPQPDN